MPHNPQYREYHHGVQLSLSPIHATECQLKTGGPLVGLDTSCFQNYLNFLLAFLKIFPIFPTNLPKFLKIFFQNQYGYKKYKNYSDACT